MLIFRLLLAIIVASFRPRLKRWQPSVVRYRVMPTDLDLNLHMNNARYSAFMDLGRLDLMTRLGIWRPLFKNRWRVVMASAGVRFHRSIAPFEGFRLESRLIGWDNKAFYGVQLFHAGGRVKASGYFRGVFTTKGKTVKMAEVRQRMDFVRQEPPQTPYGADRRQLRVIKKRLTEWAKTEQTATHLARELSKRA